MKICQLRDRAVAKYSWIRNPSAKGRKRGCKCISPEKLVDGASYTLELNQLSDEVYRHISGLKVSEEAIEVVLKRNDTYKAKEKQKDLATELTQPLPTAMEIEQKKEQERVREICDRRNMPFLFE